MNKNDFYCDSVNNGFTPCDVQCTFCLRKEIGKLPNNIKYETKNHKQ